MFSPSTIIGHMAQHCNYLVSSLDENNNIFLKKVYNYVSIWNILMRFSPVNFQKIFHYISIYTCTWKNSMRNIGLISVLSKILL